CLLVGRALEQIKPARLALVAATTPSAKELSAFLFSGGNAENLRMALAEHNLFRVWLNPPAQTYLAADYLAWSDQFRTNFDLMRRALARPRARIDCSYDMPYAMDTPNFIAM